MGRRVWEALKGESMGPGAHTLGPMEGAETSPSPVVWGRAQLLSSLGSLLGKPQTPASQTTVP